MAMTDEVVAHTKLQIWQAIFSSKEREAHAAAYVKGDERQAPEKVDAVAVADIAEKVWQKLCVPQAPD